MKTKLFENIGGNKFKLLTESMNPDRTKLIREGLKKVFANTPKELTYDKVQNFGLGFIKDVTEARKCALQEARDVAPELGFKDHPETGMFVKENDFSKLSAENPEHSLAKIGSDEGASETDMSDSEEKREVQIGREILDISENFGLRTSQHDLPEEVSKAGFEAITKLAQELIELHSPGGPVVKPGTGGKALYKRGSIY